MTRELRARLLEPGMFVAPGAYDALSARIIEEAGFPAVYCSGGAVARSSGVPDLGLLTMDDVLGRVRDIVDAVRVPVIADIDTGYGNALNVWRTVRQFERVGVAGLQLEDQITPKKCGHYDAKSIISTSEMLGKIDAALDARSDEEMVLIVRTDAIAVEGMDEAIARTKQYAAAGADVLFIEAPESRADIERVAAELSGVPLLINMFEGGRTPLLSADELAELGFKIMIVPSDLQRAAMFAMREAAESLRSAGSTAALRERMASFADRDRLVRLDDWKGLEQKYAG